MSISNSLISFSNFITAALCLSIFHVLVGAAQQLEQRVEHARHGAPRAAPPAAAALSAQAAARRLAPAGGVFRVAAAAPPRADGARRAGAHGRLRAAHGVEPAEAVRRRLRRRAARRIPVAGAPIACCCWARGGVEVEA